MNDLFEFLGIFIIAVLFIVVCAVIISIPFAFIGWALLTFMSLFGAEAEIGYWASAMTGVATITVASLIKFILSR